jgi:hypothetical protein
MLASATLCGTSLGMTPAPKAAWTVMVYLNGDNNLEEDAIKDFRELARWGGTSAVRVVVLFDRLGRATAPKAWSETVLFEMVQKIAPDPAWKPLPGSPSENAELPVSLGECNMGDGATLAGFVGWARQRYPAEREALIIWGHGQGYRAPTSPSDPVGDPFRSSFGATYRSASGDDTNRHDELFVSEIAQALKSLGGPKLSVLGFDTCLMGMVEVAYGMREVAEVMVASEELEPGAGWDYRDWTLALLNTPSMGARDLGKLLVESYERSRVLDSTPFTLSAIDLAKVQPLADAVSGLAREINASLNARRPQIAAARNDCGEYGRGAFRDGVSRFHHVDLGQFVASLSAAGAPVAVKMRVDAVLAALDDARIANVSSKDRQGKPYGSRGLAIYFPRNVSDYRSDGYERGGYRKQNQQDPVAFVQDHEWADFLAAYWGLQ